MTARTILFWQQMLNEYLCTIQTVGSLHLLVWSKNRALGFLEGVWASEKISFDELQALNADIQLKAKNRERELKAQGVTV